MKPFTPVILFAIIVSMAGYYIYFHIKRLEDAEKKGREN